MEFTCVICQTALATKSNGKNTQKGIFCPRCGYYEIEMSFHHQLQVEIERNKYHHLISSNDIPRISTWIKQKSNFEDPFILTKKDLECINLIEVWPIYKKAEELLLFFSNKVSNFAEEFYIPEIFFTDNGLIDEKSTPNNVSKWYELFGIAQIVNYDELLYLIDKYLFNETDYIYISNDISQSNERRIQITPKGWKYLSELKTTRSYDTCFVAMSFSAEYKKIYFEIIRPAILKSGWKPFCLLDTVYHNDYITNQIIAGIKRSKFLIAEFTGNCKGVYYEAGLAKGLGMEVIHMVREDYLNGTDEKKIHFDTMQINHLVWKETDSNHVIAERLSDWIAATVGYGPHHIEELIATPTA
jgi:hypothetical protein